MNVAEPDEQNRGDEMFYALQGDGLTGDVASWLVDLALRVRRLENAFEKVTDTKQSTETAQQQDEAAREI